jgi:phenylpropionate dioxygenase-like ring-hydroxylating dioxygenase large terminal subunit
MDSQSIETVEQDLSHRDRNYPMDCWWVAAFAEEIGRNLLSRWILNMPIVMYRREDGTPVAIDDRCPHRSAPLSIGSLSGDNIICGYHGFEFGPDGKCVRIPTWRGAPPARANVRSYPVVESGAFIWIYTGNLARIDDVPPPPTLEWMQDDRFVVAKGRKDIAANYMLLKENVLDLSHFGYVHAKTLKITDIVDAPEVTVEGDKVTYTQAFEAAPLSPLYSEPMGIPPGKPISRVNRGSFVSPALQVAAVDFHDAAPDPGSPEGYSVRVCHATTPIDATHMHYWWATGRDYGTHQGAVEQLTTIIDRAFEEDRVVIEAIQRTMDRDPRRKEVSVPADAAGVQARRALQRWLAREA